MNAIAILGWIISAVLFIWIVTQHVDYSGPSLRVTIPEFEFDGKTNRGEEEYFILNLSESVNLPIFLENESSSRGIIVDSFSILMESIEGGEGVLYSDPHWVPFQIDAGGEEKIDIGADLAKTRTEYHTSEEIALSRRGGGNVELSGVTVKIQAIAEYDGKEAFSEKLNVFITDEAINTFNTG